MAGTFNDYTWGLDFFKELNQRIGMRLGSLDMAPTVASL